MNDTANPSILLNFLEILPKDFLINVYCKPLSQVPEEEQKQYYQKRIKIEGTEEAKPLAIVFAPTKGFEEYTFKADFNIDLTKQYLLHGIRLKLIESNVQILGINKDKYHRVYILLKTWAEGTETIWLEPYFLSQSRSFGFLIDFKFWVDHEYKIGLTGSVDKKILQLSGTLDSRGLTNRAFYQFKYEKLKVLFTSIFPKFQSFTIGKNQFSVLSKLKEINSFALNTKVYQFSKGKESNSPYNGLKQNQPFQKPEDETRFIFIFKESDREFAIGLLNGLKGQASPSTFEGIEKMFKIPFNNSNIKGEKVVDLSPFVIQDLVTKIKQEKSVGGNVLPIILTNSKTADADHKIYYNIKNAFTKENIPCQVVTKDLVLNPNNLKYSLSNIGLQIFAKAGGKPWKVKPAIKNCLIIGIGSKNKEVFRIDESGNRRRIIEKFLTYSVLTDSSGLFKEIQILSETDNEEDYYKNLVKKLTTIIQNAAKEGNKDIVIHSPFRISKNKVWDVVFKNIPYDLNISILLINDNHKYFGFDFSKNSLVPYESTCIALSEREYLVWFEGLQYQNTTISKMIGGPIYINFWYANKMDLLDNVAYRKSLLQDCINLSGANWRGFKAKQLPVSIFYCQKIADFLKMFEDYGFEPIEFENLKPWFL
jgi:hypothetical protein